MDWILRLSVFKGPAAGNFKTITIVEFPWFLKLHKKLIKVKITVC